MVDSEGFQYKYVPKDHILTEDVIKKNVGSTGKKQRKGTEASLKDGYIYVPKNQQQTPDINKEARKGSTQKHKKEENSIKKNTLTSLLKDLKPDGSNDKSNRIVYSDSESEEDEDIKRILSRKVSMNETNVIGMNFEKYNN